MPKNEQNEINQQKRLVLSQVQDLNYPKEYS